MHDDQESPNTLGREGYWKNCGEEKSVEAALTGDFPYVVKCTPTRGEKMERIFVQDRFEGYNPDALLVLNEIKVYTSNKCIDREDDNRRNN